uniref:ARAD1D01452p n=1 Tax=Blastobotrys adeninivorans TaxID=409370 RepID=A0A060T875_BLAAD
MTTVDRRSRFGWVKRLMNRSSSKPPPGEQQSTHPQLQELHEPTTAPPSTPPSGTATRIDPERPQMSALQRPSRRSEDSREMEPEWDGRADSAGSITGSMTGSIPESTGSGAGGRTPHSRVQIVETRPEDSESEGSKRRSNSQFTVPSISRTSITTVAPSVLSSDTGETASVHTQPLLGRAISGGTAGDNASVVTIASSSKHYSQRRASFDTNASTMAIAPESLRHLSRGNSVDSIPRSNDS